MPIPSHWQISTKLVDDSFIVITKLPQGIDIPNFLSFLILPCFYGLNKE